MRARLAAKQAELDRAVAQLDVAKKHLAVVRAHLKRALVALRERLVAIYEIGTPDVLSVIVGSGGYDDLVNRTEYLDRIHGMDDAIVGRVRELRDQVKRTVDRLRTAKDRIEAARDAIAAEEQALASARAAVQSRQSALVAARAPPRGGAGEDPQPRAGARRRGRRDPGQDRRPAPGDRLGAAGGRADPRRERQRPDLAGRRAGRLRLRAALNGSYEFHPGIDIAVPSGTPIRAAAAGTVVFTESESSSGGYGNYTCIDHGGGLSTCYAHQESFAVCAGQSVSQGQVIGYSDCTGYCFGPHVHFEVRINGAVTDPMGYL